MSASSKRYAEIAKILVEHPGISQREIAKELGISESRLSELISGMREQQKDGKWTGVPIPMSYLERERIVIDYVLEHGGVNEKKLIRLIKADRTTIYNILRKHGGAKAILRKYSVLPNLGLKNPKSYWEFQSNRRLFWTWFTCIFSIAPSKNPKKFRDARFISGLGLRGYSIPEFRFFEKNIPLFRSIYRYYNSKHSLGYMLREWQDVSESPPVKLMIHIYSNSITAYELSTRKGMIYYSNESKRGTMKRVRIFVHKRYAYQELIKETGATALKRAEQILKALKFIKKERGKIKLGKTFQPHSFSVVNLEEIRKQQFGHLFKKMDVDLNLSAEGRI